MPACQQHSCKAKGLQPEEFLPKTFLHLRGLFKHFQLHLLGLGPFYFPVKLCGPGSYNSLQLSPDLNKDAIPMFSSYLIPLFSQWV